jgi:hypothetical protein
MDREENEQAHLNETKTNEAVLISTQKTKLGNNRIKGKRKEHRQTATFVTIACDE